MIELNWRHQNRATAAISLAKNDGQMESDIAALNAKLHERRPDLAELCRKRLAHDHELEKKRLEKELKEVWDE